jgi:hypothetical protein
MFPRHDGVLLGGSHDRGVWDMSVDPLVWVRGSPATGDLFWTPSGLQNGMPRRSCVCKSLRNLVGPPRFELGTSCTPSKRASQAAPRPEKNIHSREQLCDLPTVPHISMVPNPTSLPRPSRPPWPRESRQRSAGGRVFGECYYLHTRPCETPTESIHRTVSQPCSSAVEWLGGRDSNPDTQIQSPSRGESDQWNQGVAVAEFEQVGQKAQYSRNTEGGSELRGGSGECEAGTGREDATFRSEEETLP